MALMSTARIMLEQFTRTFGVTEAVPPTAVIDLTITNKQVADDLKALTTASDTISRGRGNINMDFNELGKASTQDAFQQHQGFTPQIQMMNNDIAESEATKKRLSDALQNSCSNAKFKEIISDFESGAPISAVNNKIEKLKNDERSIKKQISNFQNNETYLEKRVAELESRIAITAQNILGKSFAREATSAPETLRSRSRS